MAGKQQTVVTDGLAAASKQVVSATRSLAAATRDVVLISTVDVMERRQPTVPGMRSWVELSRSAHDVWLELWEASTHEVIDHGLGMVDGSWDAVLRLAAQPRPSGHGEASHKSREEPST